MAPLSYQHLTTSDSDLTENGASPVIDDRFSTESHRSSSSSFHDHIFSNFPPPYSSQRWHSFLPSPKTGLLSFAALVGAWVLVSVVISWLLPPEAPKLLVLYAYKESTDARRNAEFFLKHGLHDNADFIFILNGPTDLGDLIPHKDNIRVVQRPNTCYDLGSYGEILNSYERVLVKEYNRFILINASIRGPFLPPWSNECWSTAYTSKLSRKTKMVGLSYNCVGPYEDIYNPETHLSRHVQSMIFALDRTGLETLLTPAGLNTCHSEHAEAVKTEMECTRLILQKGYTVDVMIESFQSDPNYGAVCTHEDVLYEGAYFGGTVHPYETIFAKTKRGIAQTTVDNLTKWTDMANYSSYDVC